MMQEKQYDFFIDEDGNSNRHSYRAHVYGIEARVNKKSTCYGLSDISVSGCSFKVPMIEWSINERFVLQLEVKGRIILGGIKARMVRATQNNVVACSFEGLSEKQEYALDKLVLEIQKRIIALNRV